MTVNDLEDFLPRLHWVAPVIVESAGGRFIKWTGDGFLAWFETPLHREVGAVASRLFKAIWHLTFLVNVTQLGLVPKKKFKVRHAVALEQDALVIKITHADGHQSVDLIGRAVVLAFRPASFQTDFPSISTQAEIVQEYRKTRDSTIRFKKWIPAEEDRLRYFKGESWGVNSIYVSANRTPRNLSKRGLARKIRSAISHAEDGSADTDYFYHHFIEQMLLGPDWCKKMMNEECRFLREEVLSPLKRTLELLKDSSARSSSMS